MTGLNTIGDGWAIFRALRGKLVFFTPESNHTRRSAHKPSAARVEALLLAGHRAHLLGERRKAIRAFRKVTLLDPRNQEAWLALACVVGRPARRKECLRRTLAINPYSRRGRYAAVELDETDKPC
jgi:hypothetical protein